MYLLPLDSWAGSLDEIAFERWSIAPIADIVCRVRTAAPGTPIIAFPRSEQVELCDLGVLLRVAADRLPHLHNAGIHVGVAEAVQ
jgi:uroporphyrinogen-III decarboxylase